MTSNDHTLREAVESIILETGPIWDIEGPIDKILTLTAKAGSTEDTMQITDEMVERAAEAMWNVADADGRMAGPDPWGKVPEDDPMKETYRLEARAALTAALGDAEPLEVPEFVDEINLQRLYPRDGSGWWCQIGPLEHWPEGDGPTIDAAIRAAVASAKGGE